VRHVIFYRPGEGEIPLLAECRRRSDVRLLGVVDPAGSAPGTPLAEIMGLPVARAFPEFDPSQRTDLVVPSEQLDNDDVLAAVRNGPLVAIAGPDLSRLLDGDDPAVSPAAAEAEAPPGDGFADVPVSARPPGDLDAALGTLARIGDAQDRETLLPWLLSVSMASVGASSGSLMLYDPRAETLFIAAAEGLDDDILHATRQSLEQGVAGRVARTRRPELVLGHQDGSPRDGYRDRAAALCIPLVHDDDLLGVLNVNAATGAPIFEETHLADLIRVGEAMAGILHVAGGDRRLRAGRLRKHLNREFRDLATGEETRETVLAGWAAALAMALGAEHASLGLVLDDGTLALAEGTAAGETRTGAIPQQHPAWNEVLQTGRPVVVRQAEAEGANGGEGLAMFFLPVGPDPVRSVLAIRFGAPADAHRFQARAGSVAAFLEPRIADLARRYEERDHRDRLCALTAFMGETSRRPGATPDERRADLEDILRRLTGAREVTFLADPESEIAPREAAARALLERVGDAGWLTTVTEPGFMDGPSRTCLAVRSPGAEEARGILLVDKRRLHAGDSATFTEFDAVLARHLAALPLGVLASRPSKRPLDAAAPDTIAPDELVTTLAREIDRADRYHVAFSLSVFACENPGISAAAHLPYLVDHLRTSDLLFAGEEDHLFVVAPEETHAVAHLEQRVVEALRTITGDPALAVRTGRALYPGRDTTPADLVESALRTLSSRSREDD